MKHRINVRGVMIPNDYKWYYDWFGEDSTCPRDVQKVLDAMAEGDEIEVYINSPGGVIDVGSEIYTLLSVKQHFIPNLNFKLFLKTLFAFFTFILRFHHIIPKNCVYKRTGDFIKNKIQPVYMLGLKIVRPFWDEFYTGGL